MYCESVIQSAVITRANGALIQPAISKRSIVICLSQWEYLISVSVICRRTIVIKGRNCVLLAERHGKREDRHGVKRKLSRILLCYDLLTS